jgi:hypothetical protein
LQSSWKCLIHAGMAERDPGKTYSYAAVERALAATFGVDERGRIGWFRAKLQHFRRLGLAPAGPGRGKVIDYTLDDVDRWLVALEVEFFKIDPTTAISFVRGNWSDIAKLLSEARASESAVEDVLMTVHFDAMPQKLPTVGGSTTVKGMGVIADWLRGDPHEPPRRVGIFNLSVRAKALDAALANPSVRPPDPPGQAGEIIRAARRARGQE